MLSKPTVVDGHLVYAETGAMIPVESLFEAHLTVADLENAIRAGSVRSLTSCEALSQHQMRVPARIIGEL